MKVLVYGCGVIGSFLVHTLCKAGNDVTVVSRGNWKDVLETQGLKIHHQLSRQDTVDYPHVTDTVDLSERYDMVFSVMQGWQQRELLRELAEANTSLVILVGNNPEAAEMEEEIGRISPDKTVLFGFQGTAGVRNQTNVTVVSLGKGSMTVGGLHREVVPKDKKTLETAFRGTGYKLRWCDDMEGWLYTHAAFILPIVYISYTCGCDLRNADGKQIDDLMKAAKEAYGLIDAAGIQIRPVGDEKYFESGAKMYAMKGLLLAMTKTKLGDLCATDHCKNAVAEMEWLDQKYEELRTRVPAFSMPTWDKLRRAMPSWETIHETYDKHPGDVRRAEKADYANWMPKGMVTAAAAGTGVLLTADIAAHIVSKGNRTTGAKAVCTALTLGTAACAVTTGYFYSLRRAFDYDGKRKLSKQIIHGIAEYVTIPDGGTGLDVGCGSGALTIACAKRNPNAEIIGIDHWGPEYRDFTKDRCEQNAAAEGVSNVRFQKGDAVKLDFPDESFDLVTSNYVYHNITGKNKQQLLLETLRVLKKGGTFAIHDLMSKARYGDMNAFVSKLKDMGYEDVRLIDTIDGSFMSRKEAALLGLGGSTLLVGKK